MPREGLLTLLVLTMLAAQGRSALAHPGHFGLKAPKVAAEARRRPLTKADAEDLRKRLQGSWKIAGYRIWDGDDYMEVAASKETPETTTESWLFRPTGRFRHILSAGLSLTGRYEVVDGFWREGSTDEGDSRGYFVLHTFGVTDSLGRTRAHDWFLGTFMDGWRDLALFHVGPNIDRIGDLQQAQVYVRAPYGER